LHPELLKPLWYLGGKPVTDIPERRSIPTRYKGRLYRSKLEADWARTFDAIKLQHQYEKEGHYFGDVFYLPDFFLPKSRQYVEVKGLFEPDDCRKIQALLKHIPPREFTHGKRVEHGNCPDIAIVAATPGGTFWGWERGVGVDLPFKEFIALSEYRGAREVALLLCSKCRGWWFCDPTMSYRCQCCGHYDGDHSIAGFIDSPVRPFPFAFSLGETA
jgi:hypothetical protein